MRLTATIRVAIDAPDEPDYPGQTPESYAANVARALVDMLTDLAEGAQLVAVEREQPPDPMERLAARLLYEIAVEEAEFGYTPVLH